MVKIHSNVTLSQTEAVTTSQSTSAFGRRIRVIAESAWKVVKVSCIVALAASLIFLPIGIGAGQKYHTSMEKFRIETYPMAHFPNYTALYMNAGLQPRTRGDAACVMQKTIIPYQFCEDSISEAIEDLKNYSAYEQIYNEPGSFEEKGRHVQFKGKDLEMYLGINPQQYFNYKNALAYVEENLLHNFSVFKGKAQETITVCNTLHKLLCQHLPPKIRCSEPKASPPEWTPGQFRQEQMIISNNITLLEVEQQIYLQNNFSEIKLYLSSIKKLQSGEGHLTKAEKAVWEKIVHFATEPYALKSEMTLFAKQFKSKLQRKIDPIELASWVHMELVRIAPYGDCNGRLARLLMNTILYRAGYPPVIFNNATMYEDVVARQLRNLQEDIFTEFLRTEAIPWTHKQLANAIV